MTKIELKRALFGACTQFLDGRLETVQKHIGDIQESLTSETKSSAGDKHETGRAILQLEREKAGHQLAEIERVKQLLQRMDIAKLSETVALGSVVVTDQATYFLAISAGAIQIDNRSYYAIAPNTPIGQLLMGKSEGDEVLFRETNMIIRTIF